MASNSSTGRSKRAPSGDYSTGYGRPPQSGQIKKGEVRNPYGRAGKNPKREKTLDDFLERKVPNSQYSMLEMMYLQIAAGGAKGDKACMRLVLEHKSRQAAGQEPLSPLSFDPRLAQRLLKDFEAKTEARVRKKLKGGEGDGKN